MKLTELSYQNFKKADLEDMVSKSQAGDEAAFASLSQVIHQISFGYFQSKYYLQKIKTIEDAEDLAQNVSMAFQKQYKSVDNLENWLRRVLFLNFVNYYKKSKAHQFYDIDVVLRKRKVSEDHGASFDVQKILEIVQTLSGDKQKVLKMRIWDDLPFQEIAEELKKSVDAIKKIYYRTIEEIQSTIKE